MVKHHGVIEIKNNSQEKCFNVFFKEESGKGHRITGCP